MIVRRASNGRLCGQSWASRPGRSVFMGRASLADCKRLASRLCTNTGHRDAVTQTHACHLPRDSTDTVNPPQRTLSGCAECVFVCVHLRAFLVGSPCVCRAGTHPSPASRCGACVGGEYCDVFRVYRPPSPPCGYHVGSLTPTQPRRVTNPTQGHPPGGRLG